MNVFVCVCVCVCVCNCEQSDDQVFSHTTTNVLKSLIKSKTDTRQRKVIKKKWSYILSVSLFELNKKVTPLCEKQVVVLGTGYYA